MNIKNLSAIVSNITSNELKARITRTRHDLLAHLLQPFTQIRCVLITLVIYTFGASSSVVAAPEKPEGLTGEITGTTVDIQSRTTALSATTSIATVNM